MVHVIIFLILRRKNQEHFANGGLFSALIDYGKYVKEKTNIEEQETARNRKRSFTCY